MRTELLDGCKTALRLKTAHGFTSAGLKVEFKVRNTDRCRLQAERLQPATVYDNTLDLVALKPDCELQFNAIFGDQDLFDDFYFDDPDGGGSV